MLADREETIFCLTGFLCTIKYGSMLKSRLRKRKKKRQSEMLQVIWIHLKGMYLQYREETIALSSAFSPMKAHRINFHLRSLCQPLVFWRENNGHRCQRYTLEVQYESPCQIWWHQFYYLDDTSSSMKTTWLKLIQARQEISCFEKQFGEILTRVKFALVSSLV